MVKVFTGMAPSGRSKALVELYPKLTTAGRVFVLRTLTELVPTPESTKLLLKALESSTPTIVGTAADTCGQLGIQASIQPLMTAYQDAYQTGKFLVVQSIFEALGALKAEQAHSILERHTTDSQPGVKRSAHEALKQIDRAMRSEWAEAALEVPSYLEPWAPSAAGDGRRTPRPEHHSTLAL